MKKFIRHILFILILSFLFFEFALRAFNLTNDVPKRNLLQNRYQVYRKSQEGIYKNAKWVVNDYGFLGLSDIDKGENQILLIQHFQPNTYRIVSRVIIN